MSTLVFLHAHPDDEAIGTGGSIARAAAEGHRVVLVVATNGDWGETPDDLAEGESLVERRQAETMRSAEALGIARVEWLGYEDSGMTGWEQNQRPGSFWQAEVDEAAGRLADILTAERAELLCTYDWHGNYGHPDHVKVHHVGHRAAVLAGTPRVVEMTMNRDDMRRFLQMAREAGMGGSGEGGTDDFDPDGPADDGNPMGTPESEITLAVDVRAYASNKRASMRAHASQITDTSFFLEMPEEAFAAAFGTEWFIERDVPTGSGPRVGWLLD